MGFLFYSKKIENLIDHVAPGAIQIVAIVNVAPMELFEARQTFITILSPRWGLEFRRNDILVILGRNQFKAP